MTVVLDGTVSVLNSKNRMEHIKIKIHPLIQDKKAQVSPKNFHHRHMYKPLDTAAAASAAQSSGRSNLPVNGEHAVYACYRRFLQVPPENRENLGMKFVDLFSEVLLLVNDVSLPWAASTINSSDVRNLICKYRDKHVANFLDYMHQKLQVTFDDDTCLFTVVMVRP
jgi:hypothetical protein